MNVTARFVDGRESQYLEAMGYQNIDSEMGKIFFKESEIEFKKKVVFGLRQLPFVKLLTVRGIDAVQI